MNAKLKKAIAEREKNTQRIAEMQERNDELDRQVTELENAEMHDVLRKAGMSFEEWTQQFPQMVAERNAAPEAEPDHPPEAKADPLYGNDDPAELTQEVMDYEEEETPDEYAEADGEIADGDDFDPNFSDDAGGDWDHR